jgi:hypothetical protein
MKVGRMFKKIFYKLRSFETLSMNKIFLSLSLLFSISFNLCGQQKEEYILDENFDRNRIGWVEEYTSAHSTGIKDGHLYIISKDTSKERSSNGPQNVSFLWDLPTQYEIVTSITKLKSSKEAHYGILLYSSSLTYKFSFSTTGLAELTEYDYNKDNEDLYLFSQQTKIKAGDSAILKIMIDNRRYSFYVNNEKIREGELKARSWTEMRLFVSSGAGIRADYLRIKKSSTPL